MKSILIFIFFIISVNAFAEFDRIFCGTFIEGKFGKSINHNETIEYIFKIESKIVSGNDKATGDIYAELSVTEDQAKIIESAIKRNNSTQYCVFASWSGRPYDSRDINYIDLWTHSIAKIDYKSRFYQRPSRP